MDKFEAIKQMEQTATERAKNRARAASWNLDVALFACAVFIIVAFFSFLEMKIEIIAIVAVAGLAMVWLGGLGHGNTLYESFYDEELTKLKQESVETIKELVEETVDEKVRRALRQWSP